LLIEEMPEAYRMTRFNMWLKTHFLRFKLSIVSINFGGVSNEYGLKCHQDVSMLRKRYEEKCNQTMLANCYRQLIREADTSGNRFCTLPIKCIFPILSQVVGKHCSFLFLS
jgi:hypothetical protein